MSNAEAERARPAIDQAGQEIQLTESRSEMTVERYLRLLAGAFVLFSLVLGYWVSHYWFLFTAFVGLNLFQSGITNWCPMISILRKASVNS